MPHALRIVLVALCLAVLNVWTPACLAQEPPETAPPAPPPDRAMIEKLIRQLGDENFHVREAAEKALSNVSESTEVLLKKAIKDDDAEVTFRSKQLLFSLQSAFEEVDFKKAMLGIWPAGLRQGKLSGPVFGHLGNRNAVHDASINSSTKEEDTFVRVETALRWLVQHQKPEGYWESQVYGAELNADLESTSLVLLTLLSTGYSENIGKYKDNVRRAIRWLGAQQNGEGALIREGWRTPDGLAHATAALALTEASNQSTFMQQPRSVLSTPMANQALTYTLRHQSIRDGKPYGFGRLPQSNSPDLLTTAIVCMQLRSAIIAEIPVDSKVLDGVTAFLDDVDDKDLHQYALTPGGKCTAEATALGILARVCVGASTKDMKPYLRQLKEHYSVSAGSRNTDSLVNWLATKAIFMAKEETWEEWCKNARMVLTSHRDEGEEGSWTPVGQWCGSGRVFATATQTMTMSVFYRYLPLYKWKAKE